MHRLDHHIRADLDSIAPRRMAVLDPLRLVITNMPEGQVDRIECRNFPGRAEDESTYTVAFTRVCYIERSDFKEQDEKGYFGLAPGKAAMLRYAYPVNCTGFTRGSDGRVSEIQCEYNRDWKAQGAKPPKGVLHWVSCPEAGREPPRLEARLYDVLFRTEDVNSLGDSWLEDLNPESEVVTFGYAGEQRGPSLLGYVGLNCALPDPPSAATPPRSWRVPRWGTSSSWSGSATLPSTQVRGLVHVMCPPKQGTTTRLPLLLQIRPSWATLSSTGRSALRTRTRSRRVKSLLAGDPILSQARLRSTRHLYYIFRMVAHQFPSRCLLKRPSRPQPTIPTYPTRIDFSP